MSDTPCVAVAAAVSWSLSLWLQSDFEVPQNKTVTQVEWDAPQPVVCLQGRRAQFLTQAQAGSEALPRCPGQAGLFGRKRIVYLKNTVRKGHTPCCRWRESRWRESEKAGGVKVKKQVA
jgi:hypothetical protein